MNPTAVRPYQMRSILDGFKWYLNEGASAELMVLMHDTILILQQTFPNEFNSTSLNLEAEMQIVCKPTMLQAVYVVASLLLISFFSLLSFLFLILLAE